MPRWRHGQDQSPATRSRWPWSWGADDSVFHKDGQPFAWVGRWWSGQQKRGRSGMDGVLLLVVIGDGKLVVPVDCAIRRPDPQGPGGPCRDKLRWARVRRDERLEALKRRGLELPAPGVVADRWFGDSKVMMPGRLQPQGPVWVEGTGSYRFALPAGRQVKGGDLLTRSDWPWRDSPWALRVR